VKIFIDFDDVLFDTRNFRADFQNIFSQFGIADDIYTRNYYNYPPNNQNFPETIYILEEHLKKIGKIISFDEIALKRKIQNLLKDTRKYVFSDVESLLQNFSRKELFLISHGDPNFQKKKINNSGISHFFGVVKISRIFKSQEIKKIINKSDCSRKKEKYLFLDDRVHYIEEVKKCLPEIITILIKRPEGRYWDQKNCYCNFTAKNLKKALRIIKGNK